MNQAMLSGIILKLLVFKRYFMQVFNQAVIFRPFLSTYVCLNFTYFLPWNWIFLEWPIDAHLLEIFHFVTLCEFSLQIS